MINTLNESSLHKALKTIYSLEKETVTEEKVGQWICDIINLNTDEVIEIQTSNVSSLKNKTAGLLSLGKKVKIVHPVIIEKTIETYGENGNIITKRKSPKKENIYSIFRQLTGLTNLLLNTNFTLEIIEISVTEIRSKTEAPVQLKNKSRRFLRNWIKTDKKLNKIFNTYQFKTKKDYISLLPSEIVCNTELKKDFTVKQVQKYSAKNRTDKANITCMIWVLRKLELIEEIYREKREIHYKIN